MKFLFIICGLLLSLNCFAQFGIKAGYTYNADSGLYKPLDQTYSRKGEASVGFHANIFRQFNFVGFYLTPEIAYVNFKNEFKDAFNQAVDINYQRIDLPVSIGKTLFRIGKIQGGPVFSYHLKDDISLENIKQVHQEDFNMALQVGAGVSIQKIVLLIRYDFSLGDRETKWVGENTDQFSTESSPKLLHISLGYQF